MGARIVIVSNRVAVPERSRTPVAGGLAVAVKAALKNRNGMWFGWSGAVEPNPDAAPRMIETNKVTYALIDLAETDFQEYYNGLANRVLWPILHYRVDLQEYSRGDASGYLRVNRLFADKLSPLLRDDDVIWVHDYHLMPFGRELRKRGHKNPIGFFLHIPCAPPDILQALPSHTEILGSLTYYDLVGFQTDNDRENFAHYLVSQGARETRADIYEMNDRQVRLGVFPVSIETAVYNRLARNAIRSPEVERVRGSLEGHRLVLGVDRLDYSKGIPQRIRAFEAFLEANPEWRGRLTLLQITPKSRAEIKEYAEIEAEVTSLIGRINGRFGDAAWTPHPLYQQILLAHRARRDLSRRGRRHGDAVARRNESGRQGVSRCARSERSRRPRSLAVRRRSGKARSRADRQSPRNRGRRGGAQARLGHAPRRAPRAARADAAISAQQRHSITGPTSISRLCRGATSAAGSSTVYAHCLRRRRRARRRGSALSVDYSVTARNGSDDRGRGAP